MWYFFSPNIIYGEDALDFFENVPGEKCFIVTDKNLVDLGLVKILTDKLDKFGKKSEIFSDVKPDPHEEDILAGKAKCVEFAPDIIIGLGGGSVMDTAKAIWPMYEYPNYGVDDFHPFNMDLYNLGRKAKLVAIPTTSGTGAEATWAVVISRLENDVWIKLEQAHKGLVPTYSIVDPIFAKGMPKSLTADTGFDALAHSLEGIVSVWRNEFSDAMLLKAVELIFKYLPIACKDPSNMEARDYMAQAATMAGLGFGNSQAHLGHAMGHSWGAVFHTPHGKAVGVFLPYITQYCLNNPDENDQTIPILSKLAKQLGWAKWGDDDKKSANLVVEKTIALQKEVGLPTKLADVGISKEDLEKNMDLLINLCFQSACTTMSPRSPDKATYTKLFTHAYEGKAIDF